MRSLSIKLIILGTSRDLSAENFFNVSNRATIARLKAKRAISGTAEFIETKDVEAQGHEPVNAEIIMRQKDTDELTSLYCFEHATPPDVIIAVFDAASRLSLEGIEKALGVLKGMEIGCAFWVVADTAGVWEAVGGGTRLRDIRIPSVDAGVAEGLALAARCGCGFSVISSERYEDVDGVVFDVIVGFMDNHPDFEGRKRSKSELEKGSRMVRFFSLFRKSNNTP